MVPKPVPDQGGQKQLRKQAESQDDKYRVTYEARQVISGPYTKLQNKLITVDPRRVYYWGGVKLLTIQEKLLWWRVVYESTIYGQFS